jgi:plasmid stability protein
MAAYAFNMPAITIRNIPEPVHAALRRIAADRHVSVEALARAALGDLATQARPGGIDFRKLARDRAELGLTEDGPQWTEALDDPAFSRRVLGMDGGGMDGGGMDGGGMDGG